MSQPIVVTLPEALSDRVREIAAASDRPAEQLIIEHLQETFTPPEPILPPELQAELDRLRTLSDDELWSIAREQMPNDAQARGHYLMERNSLGTITEQERAELDRYADRSDFLMVRKAEASGLLRERGYTFTLADFKPTDE
jgi:hypothetical protein